MLLHHSLAPPLLISLLRLLFLHTINAQSGTLSITNFTTDTAIDLYKMYNDHNGTSGYSLRGAEFHWEISDEQGPIEEDFKISTISIIELMAGPADEASDAVVDIITTDTFVGSAGVTYYYPASLPLGLYHARVKVFVDGFNTNVDTQGLTARSPTIKVTTSSPIGCGPKKPAPYTNVPSTLDPNFSSIRITHPSASSNVAFDPNTPIGQNILKIRGGYRSTSPFPLPSIFNLTAQILDSETSTPVGPIMELDAKTLSMDVKFSEVPMKLNGSYIVEVKYLNKFRDGAVEPGNFVTIRTQGFNVVLPEDSQSDCGMLNSSSQSSSSAPRVLRGFLGVAWVGCLAVVIL